MTVAELRHLLEEFNDDDIIVLSCDSEGNRFSPLLDVTTGFYIEDSEWSGDFVDVEEVDEDENINVTGSPTAVALWPTN